MHLRFSLIIGLVLGLAGSARAQTAPVVTTYTATAPDAGPFGTERDSLRRRAARVRARTAARTVRFESSFGGVGGTRRRITSYGRLQSKNRAASSPGYAPIKQQIVKHKTSAVAVEKIRYFGLDKRLLLSEYYEQQQLVRLELREYPLREGNEYGKVFRETQWVRGDYLRLITREQNGKGPVHRYYFTAPSQPE